MESIENFVRTAKSLGMKKEQLERFVLLKYIPLRWQMVFHRVAEEADVDGGPVDIGVGGARGPGKSHSVFAQVVIDDCQRVAGLKGLFLRQTGKAAKESFEDLIEAVLRSRASYEYSPSRGAINFENGSRLLLGGFENENDIEKYVGIQYDVMAVEELNQLTEEKVLKLKGSLRTSKEGWRPRMYTSFNPGGIGHNFIKENYIIPFREGRETSTRFIPANYKDNPYLNTEYVDYLEGLTGNLGRAWREGDWDIFEGQYFTEWRNERHTCQPFEVPEGWPRYRSYDHGRSKPACCKWYAVDYDGRVWVYREYYPTGVDADEIAQEIIKLSAKERYRYSVADPSIFSNTGMIDRKTGAQTIAEIFARYGVAFIRGNNDRVHGWTTMHQYLRWTEEDRPKIVYFSTCVDSIRTIPKLMHDKHRPEDLDSDGEDHCFTGDTLIDTLTGKRTIKSLVGKEVWVNTQMGFQKCRSVHKTRVTQIWEIQISNGKRIKATSDHKFLTQSGWKMLKCIDLKNDYLLQSSICISKYLALFRSLMGNAITFVANTFNEKVRSYILMCGNVLMEKFPKVTMYTTLTMTEQIMTFPILSYSPHLIISRITPVPKNQKQEAENLSKLQEMKQPNGINQRKEESGMFNKRYKWLKNGSGLKRFASNVQTFIEHLNNLLFDLNSAVKIVKLQPCGEEEVYDLTVPSVSHFTVEGGIVVHNCADVDRYLLQSLHEAKAPKPIDSIQVKIDKLRRTKFDISTDFYANQI